MGACEDTRGEPMGHADDELIREVRHAAGNLVQRIQYWTVLLEDELPAERAGEPFASLRSSLDCLHRLVVRSLDLLRATESRPITVSIGDVATAFALRFGGAEAITVESSDTMNGDVAVDPLLLERALALLSEVLAAPEDVTNDRAAITVSRDPDTTRAAVTVSLRATWRDCGGDPFARVQARVALALALKLLDSSSVVTHVVESDDGIVLRVVIPLHFNVQHDDASTHSTRSRDSRESLPL